MPEDNFVPSFNLAYYLENNVSIFADIVLTLGQETFRRGFSWKPRFACKCAFCGAEYQEKQTQCSCGSAAFNEPDRGQIQRFRRTDGRTFLESANLNDNSLKEELRDFQRNRNIADRGYLLCIKKYVWDPVDINLLLSAAPVEFLSIDPRDIKPIKQDNGLPGGKVWVCLEHRDVVEDNPNKPCRVCGRQLYDALYETYGSGADKKYYVKGEVLTKTQYYKNGYPPILKMLYDAYSYHYLEMRTYNFWKRGRVPGLITFPTNNLPALEAWWQKAKEAAREDPDNVQLVGYDAGQGKGAAQFLKLMEDPGPGMLEVKKDLRERMGSMFGVSLIFQGDTSSSGGLNNEGLQITVTNRAVEDAQSGFNGDPETCYGDGILSWICQQFGITDFVLQLNPSEEQDEMAEKQRDSQDIQNARGMYDMGFDVKFENGKFTYSGQSKPKPEPAMFGAPASAPVLPPAQPERVSGAPLDVHKELIEKEKIETKPEPDELDEYHGDELIKSFAGDALKAIRQGALYSFYSDVPEDLITKIHDIIKEQFIEHRLNLREMVDKMTALGIEENQARMIARTESTGVAMKARELGWKRMEQQRGEQFMYKAVITDDERTSPISRRIKAAVDAEGGAVPLERLKEIYREESQKPYIPGDPENSGMGPGWTGWENFVGHPYERDSIVRVVELSKIGKIEEQLAMQKLELYKKMAEKL